MNRRGNAFLLVENGNQNFKDTVNLTRIKLRGVYIMSQKIYQLIKGMGQGTLTVNPRTEREYIDLSPKAERNLQSKMPRGKWVGTQTCGYSHVLRFLA